MTIDPFARNPLVDDMRSNSAALFNSASRSEGPPPGLFPTGDLPPTTASGNPPSDLLKLPWNIRHGAAKADQAEWSRLMNNYSKAAWEDGLEILVSGERAAHDHANEEYRARVSAWVIGR